MNDEWRLQIDLHEANHAGALIESIDARQIQHDLSEAFHDRIVVTHDGPRVFLYTRTREQAERSRHMVEVEAVRRGWTADVTLLRWHPNAEEWEEPDKALPADDVGGLGEREALMAREREETAVRGYPEFEVRANLPSHHDAAGLSKQLQSEGIPTVHRWRYLLVGATDEDSAHALAMRIQKEAPPGSRVEVEGTWAAVSSERSPGPFAIFGG